MNITHVTDLEGVARRSDVLPTLLRALHRAGVANRLIVLQPGGLGTSTPVTGVDPSVPATAIGLGAPMDPRPLLTLRRVLLEGSTDVVHLHPGAPLLAAAAAAELASLPSVATIVPDETRWSPSWNVLGAGPVFVRHVLVQSESAAALVSGDSSSDPAPFTCIRPGIDAVERRPERRLAMRNTWCVEADRLLAGCLDSSSDGSGASALFEAVARLREGAAAARSLQVVVAASDALRPALRAAARRLRLDAVVSPMPPDPEDFFAACDAFVEPAPTARGTHRCLQAMSGGLPVVAGDRPSVRDAVAHGVSGWLVPAGDLDALREALSRLTALSPGERAEMGRMGRLRAGSYFDPDRTAQETCAVYRAVLARPDAAPPRETERSGRPPIRRRRAASR